VPLSWSPHEYQEIRPWAGGEAERSGGSATHDRGMYQRQQLTSQFQRTRCFQSRLLLCQDVCDQSAMKVFEGEDGRGDLGAAPR
jgi:hypothetical protein